MRLLRIWRQRDGEERTAAERAMAHVRSRYPRLRVTNVRLRARERERLVFAVFFNDPERQTVPGDYRLIAVLRDTCAIEELETSPGSPYWIRGRK